MSPGWTGFANHIAFSIAKSGINLSKEDNNIQTNEDEEDSGSIKAEGVCLREWWDDYTELKQFPHKEIEELVHEERSHLSRCMFESEQFREKYGDSLIDRKSVV